MTPIDTATNAPGTPIPVGSSPSAIAITPDGMTAYVANSNVATVTPIDLTTNTPGTPIAVGINPEVIAITPDGTTVYVVNEFGDSGDPDRCRHQHAWNRYPRRNSTSPASL